MEEQKRHSGFETMRILSMVMIVLMHGIGHGGLGSAAPQGSAAFWIYWLLFILARVSTNCFVMLSGYYLSERKGAVRAGRLFRIGAQVWFYSMLTFCVAVKAGAVPLSAISLLRALLPLTSNGYWFASAYFLMYLSVPVLNTVVQSLDRRQYKTLLLVALLLQSVWGTLFNWATDVTFVNNGYSFIWFYTLYFMAAYFRKYRVTVPSGLCLLAYLAASAAGLFNRMLALRVENALHLNGFVNTVNGYQALATVIASAAMFLLFQNIRIRSDYWRRWVFRLAPLSFGVYLLHDSDFTRALLWQLVDLPRFGGALLPSLAYLTGAVLLIAAAVALLWPSESLAPAQEEQLQSAAADQAARLEDGAELFQRLSYTRCEHVVTRRVTAPVELYGKTLEEIQPLYPEWRITEFSPKALRMERQVPLFCPDHQVLMPNAGGTLCIYENKYGDALALVSELSVSLSALPAAAQEEVQDGLGFSTPEELEAWLENMES